MLHRLVANALDTIFTKGDAIAIDMPMTSTAVIIYLATILAGYVVVSIADSFAAKEISTRMRISKAKGIFTQVFLSDNLQSEISNTFMGRPAATVLLKRNYDIKYLILCIYLFSCFKILL